MFTRTYSDTLSVTISARTSGSRGLVQPPVVHGVPGGADEGDRPAPHRRFRVTLTAHPPLQGVQRGALGLFGLLDGFLSLCVGRHRVPCLFVAHLLVLYLRLFARFRRSRQADRQEGAASALPAGCGEVPLRQRVGVRPAPDVVSGKLTEPLAGVPQGPLQPCGGNPLPVPGASPRVHRGDHRVPQVAELAERVEGGLGHRRRVAALGSQRLPALERLRSPRLDLDDHRVAVGGTVRLSLEEEELRRSRFVPLYRQPHRAVGVSGDQQIGADAHRHLLRVLGIGGIDVPARPLHRPHHHRLQGVARLHRRQRGLAGGIRGFVARRGVPEGAAAAQG